MLKRLLTAFLASLALWHVFGVWIRRWLEERGAAGPPSTRRRDATPDDPFRNAPIEPR